MSEITRFNVERALERKLKGWRHTWVTKEPYEDGSVFAGGWKFNSLWLEDNRLYIKKAYSYKSLLELVQAD